MLRGLEHVTLIEGAARFSDAQSIDVNGRTFSSKHFVIATGSTATVPAVPGLRDVAFWTHVDALQQEQRPASVDRSPGWGRNAGSERAVQNASASPITGPGEASTKLSVNSCPTTRTRLLPRANRTGISLRREAARASSRFATFPHAISKTRATAAISMASAG
ncbi:MAG: hypothetical protein DMF84_30525 [Acidobacteria bacterium]|nr:MAG: hypothetical protein DMF84_30525 [Acidobacteriota bacterium]